VRLTLSCLSHAGRGETSSSRACTSPRLCYCAIRLLRLFPTLVIPEPAPCAGVDPTKEQWHGIQAVMQERGLFPWFDTAYQGFASGDLDEDAWAVRMFAAKVRQAGRVAGRQGGRGGLQPLGGVSHGRGLPTRASHAPLPHRIQLHARPLCDSAHPTPAAPAPPTHPFTRPQGMEFLVCQSFAKNFGMYCERVGALHICAADPASAAAALSILEVIIRPMYSNPPAHGARTIAHILTHPELEAVRAVELLPA